MNWLAKTGVSILKFNMFWTIWREGTTNKKFKFEEVLIYPYISYWKNILARK